MPIRLFNMDVGNRADFKISSRRKQIMTEQTQLEQAVVEHQPIWVEVPTTTVAQAVIAFGHERNMTFKPVEHHGLLVEPFVKGDFLYFDISDQPDFPMPKSARERLFLVGCHFPIKQIIIADDTRKPLELRKAAEKVGKVVVGTAGILAIGAAIVGAVIGYAILYDPKLIVVCSDDTWVSICEWL
jgi:hypothetical protein